MAKIVALLFAGCLLASSGVAHAIPFTLNSYSVTTHQVDPGLRVTATSILGLPFNFDLDPGESTLAIPLFSLSTDECCVNSTDPDDDTDPKLLTVDFNVTPGGDGQVLGTTFGEEFSADPALSLEEIFACLVGIGPCFGIVEEKGVALFGPAASLPVGDGTFLQIALSPSPTFFNQGFFDLGSTPGTVDVTFSRTTADVPEPSTMLLFGTGLLYAVAKLRRRV